MKYSQDGALLAVAASSGEIYIHDAADHYSLKTTTSEFKGREAIAALYIPPSLFFAGMMWDRVRFNRSGWCIVPFQLSPYLSGAGLIAAFGPPHGGEREHTHDVCLCVCLVID